MSQGSQRINMDYKPEPGYKGPLIPGLNISNLILRAKEASEGSKQGSELVRLGLRRWNMLRLQVERLVII